MMATTAETAVGMGATARRTVLSTLLFGTISCGHALGDYPAPDHDWTVLTLAIDGSSWGTATDGSPGRAIAFAIRNCRMMSERPTSCGARFTSIRGGWSVAMRCGDEGIIAAAEQRGEAERMASDREAELRLVYRRDMPPCIPIVTINPEGAVLIPPVRATERR